LETKRRGREEKEQTKKHTKKQNGKKRGRDTKKEVPNTITKRDPLTYVKRTDSPGRTL
jgi:hypothetical protein